MVYHNNADEIAVKAIWGPTETGCSSLSGSKTADFSAMLMLSLPKKLTCYDIPVSHRTRAQVH